MKRWEYKMTRSSDTAELNALGEQGWEMVNFTLMKVRYTDKEYEFVFKREK
jgi:hypothetical protein